MNNNQNKVKNIFLLELAYKISLMKKMAKNTKQCDIHIVESDLVDTQFPNFILIKKTSFPLNMTLLWKTHGDLLIEDCRSKCKKLL